MTAVACSSYYTCVSIHWPNLPLLLIATITILDLTVIVTPINLNGFRHRFRHYRRRRRRRRLLHQCWLQHLFRPQ